MVNNISSIKEDIETLKRGDTILLTDIGIERNNENIGKINKCINKKNVDYQIYSPFLKVLEFNEELFSIKSCDYFGYIELDGKILKSNGDYILEYEKKKVYIKNEDVDYINEKRHEKQFKNAISIKKKDQLRKGSYSLKTNKYVGVITLPSGFRIQIIPKIKNTALIYILCFLYNIEIDEIIESKFPQGNLFLDFIALLFKSEFEKIIEQGLLKKYVEEEENQNFFKGKLLINNQIKYNSINKQKFYCRYDELTYNNLENKTILYSLTILIELVHDNQLRKELVDLKWLLDTEVTSIRLLNIEHIDKIVFSRLNDYYQKIINLSRQIIREVFIRDINSKEIQAYGYLIDMNNLYESFVFKLIEDLLKKPQTPYKIKKQVKDINILIKPTNNAPKIFIKPDILICSDKKLLVIDTKYKEMKIYYENEKAKPCDVYQIISYSLAHECNGMLIFPEVDTKIRYYYEFPNMCNNKLEIFIITINITSDEKLSKKGFDVFIDRIKKELQNELPIDW